MPSFDFRGHMSCLSEKSILTYARTQCFFRKVTYSVSRAPGNGAVEKFCPSVSADVSAVKNAGIDDA